MYEFWADNMSDFATLLGALGPVQELIVKAKPGTDALHVKMQLPLTRPEVTNIMNQLGFDKMWRTLIVL